MNSVDDKDARLAALERRVAQLEQALTLGLGGLPKVRIYCNRNHGGLWYTWDSDRDTAIAIEQEAITGYLSSLEIALGEYKGDTTYTMQLGLKCGSQEFILCAGHHSSFAKCLYFAIATIPAETIRTTPITVTPRAGNDEKALMASVFVNGEIVKNAGWSNSTSSDEIKAAFQAARKNIAEANQQ